MKFSTLDILDKKNDVVTESIRPFSLRRHLKLDFKSSKFDIRQKGKYFLGFEKNKKLSICRLRNTIGLFFPKLIFEFDENENDKFNVRFSYLSLTIIFFLLFSLIVNLISVINSNRIESDLYGIVIYILIFNGLTYLEFKICVNKIKKSIREYELKKIKTVANNS